MKWIVYLLHCADNTLYCGITNNIEKRISQHNGILTGGARYTSTRRPVHIIGTKLCDSKSIALKLEYKVKKLNKSKKLDFFKDQNA